MSDAQPQFSGYDVIGEVHGYADKLEGLLRELCYFETPQPDRRMSGQLSL